MAKIWVRVADTPFKQSQGLMFVKEMPEDEGMLFSFSDSQVLKFWGENTFIPLDIAFVDKDGIIKKLDYIKPLSRSSITSEVPCLFAIEANSGYFAKNDIGVGDKINIKSDDRNGDFVEFDKIRTSIWRESQIEQNEIYEEDVNPNEEINPNKNLPVINPSDIVIEDDIEDYPIEQHEEPINEEQDEQYEFLPTPEIEDQPSFNNAFDASDWSEENKEVMHISYITKKGIRIERDVEPHGTFHSESTNKQILVTFDRTVGGIRAFIMQNIEGVSFPNQKFENRFLLSQEV